MQPRYLRTTINHELIEEWVQEGLIERTDSTYQLIKYYPVLDLKDLDPLSTLLVEHDYEGLNLFIPEICKRNSHRFNEESLKEASKKDFPKDFYHSKVRTMGLNFARVAGEFGFTSLSKATKFIKNNATDFLLISPYIGILAFGSFVITMPFRTPYDGELMLGRPDKDTIGGLVMHSDYIETKLIISPSEKFESVLLEVTFQDTPDKARITVLRSDFRPINTSLFFNVGDKFKELKFDKPNRLTLVKINR
jgi:hypothetical protein